MKVTPTSSEAAGEATPPQQTPAQSLDRLFRHVLRQGQVNPLYFLLQRFRQQQKETAEHVEA
ncbi:MAG: hypothetical protein IV107_04940 [Paucibacter sp.]|nr:hypothetical protein [Roseateles sp.]